MGSNPPSGIGPPTVVADRRFIIVTCMPPGIDSGTSDTYASPLVVAAAESGVGAKGEDTRAGVAGTAPVLSGAAGLFEHATRSMAAHQGTARPDRAQQRLRNHDIAAASPRDIGTCSLRIRESHQS
jgi:hypothetical protein